MRNVKRQRNARQGRKKRRSRNDALRVFPAVTRLTVYRRLQVDGSPPASSNEALPFARRVIRMQAYWPGGATRTYPEKSASFFEKVEFFDH